MAPRRRRKLSRAARASRSPRPPASAVLAYRISLGRIADRFAASIRRAVFGRLDRFALERSDAEESADGLASVAIDTRAIFAASAGAVDKTERHSKSEFKRIGIPLDKEPALSKLTGRWRKSSAERVESILKSERETISALLADSEHRTPEELLDRIEERFVIAKSKVQTAARDDILTLNGQITQARQEAAGIEEFEWTCAADGRTRESHLELDGKRFRWDDPPEVDGEIVIPGEPPNCRCVAFPVLPELEDEEAA